MSENTTPTYKQGILTKGRKLSSTIFRTAAKPVRFATNVVQAMNPFATVNSDNGDNWGVSADVRYIGDGDYTDERGNSYVLSVFKDFNIMNNIGATTSETRNCFTNHYKYVAKKPSWIPGSGNFVCVVLKEANDDKPVINEKGRFTITDIPEQYAGSRKSRRTRGKYRRTRGKSRRTRGKSRRTRKYK